MTNEKMEFKKLFPFQIQNVDSMTSLGLVFLNSRFTRTYKYEITDLHYNSLLKGQALNVPHSHTTSTHNANSFQVHSCVPLSVYQSLYLGSVEARMSVVQRAKPLFGQAQGSTPLFFVLSRCKDTVVQRCKFLDTSNTSSCIVSVFCVELKLKSKGVSYDIRGIAGSSWMDG